MTNDELLDDLKQFITVTVSQAVGELRSEMNARFDKQDARLDGHDEQFRGIIARFDEQDEKLNTILDAVGEDIRRHDDALADHEARIQRLEKKFPKRAFPASAA